MGDRICLTFVSKEPWGEERSPVLYAHWDGRDLLANATRFWAEHHGKVRSEPSNWMVNFVSWLREGAVEDGNYYLYPDEEHCCSPDDNGFWEFDTVTGEYRQTSKGDWE